MTSVISGSVEILRNHRGGRGVSKILKHDCREREVGRHYDEISKNIFFSKNEIVLKQKTINN